MVNTTVAALIVVIAVMGSAFGSYYFTATPLNSEISTYQTSVASYQSAVYSLSAHPSTTTIFSTTTQTTTAVSVRTSTTTYFPIPNNVSVFFDNSGSYISYRIDTTINGWGGYTDATSFNQTVTPLQNNEWISVQASCSNACTNGTNFSALLLVNNYPVAVASGNSYTALLINYTI